jgi:hypothetical protein
MIPKEIFTDKLRQIEKKLEDWNYETVNGKGLYKTMVKYAHLEIEIRKRKDENSQIIWSITDEQIPSKFYDYKSYVKETVDFFVDYINSLKGEKTELIFEIRNGSYHPVDTYDRLYSFATLNAIINCFDVEIEKFDENWVEHIKKIVRKIEK